MSGGPRNPADALRVLVDGAPLAEPEARAFWERFSAWMEEHKGDLLGFAKVEGFASVHPGVDQGRPVLRASRTAPQQVYAAVRGEELRAGPGGPGAGAPSSASRAGSSPSHAGGSGSRQTGRSGQPKNRQKSRGKSR